MTTALENMWVGIHKETGEQWVSSVGTKVWGRPGDVKNSLRYHEEEDSYDVTQVTLTPLAEEHIGERSLFCVLNKGMDRGRGYQGCQRSTITSEGLRMKQSGYMVKGADGDPGYDIRNEGPDVTIQPGGYAYIDTKVAVDIPRGLFGILTHRSSLAFKKQCILSLGIIDSNFKGHMKGMVFNLGYDEQVIKRGERFAQFIPVMSMDQGLNPVPALDVEGKEGFGSTGT